MFIKFSIHTESEYMQLFLECELNGFGSEARL